MLNKEFLGYVRKGRGEGSLCDLEGCWRQKAERATREKKESEKPECDLERSWLKDPSERLHQYIIRERRCWEEKSVRMSEEERNCKDGR